MTYFLKSICTFSFWKYAIFSKEAAAKLLATAGSLYFLMELMDFLSIYTKDNYSKFAIFPIIGFSVIYVVITRRPASRIIYKIPNKDYCFEVKVGDIFSSDADVIISTNTTFDTDMSNGLIAPDSLQGAIMHFATQVDKMVSARQAGRFAISEACEGARLAA